MSGVRNRDWPPDSHETRLWLYASGLNGVDPQLRWVRAKATDDGRIRMSVSGSEVAIQGTNSAADRQVVTAEDLDDGIAQSQAVGLVTWNARATEDVGATELRSHLYDTGGNQKSPIGTGDVDQLVTSGATAGISGSVALGLGDVRQDVDLWFDVASAGDIITDVSKISGSRQASGTTWRRFNRRSVPSGGAASMVQFETTYRFIRTWASGVSDGDVTLLEMAGQGVS